MLRFFVCPNKSMPGRRVGDRHPLLPRCADTDGERRYRLTRSNALKKSVVHFAQVSPARRSFLMYLLDGRNCRPLASSPQRLALDGLVLLRALSWPWSPGLSAYSVGSAAGAAE